LDLLELNIEGAFVLEATKVEANVLPIPQLDSCQLVGKIALEFEIEGKLVFKDCATLNTHSVCADKLKHNCRVTFALFDLDYFERTKYLGLTPSAVSTVVPGSDEHSYVMVTIT